MMIRKITSFLEIPLQNDIQKNRKNEQQKETTQT